MRDIGNEHLGSWLRMENKIQARLDEIKKVIHPGLPFERSHSGYLKLVRTFADQQNRALRHAVKALKMYQGADASYAVSAAAIALREMEEILCPAPEGEGK